MIPPNVTTHAITVFPLLYALYYFHHGLCRLGQLIELTGVDPCLLREVPADAESDRALDDVNIRIGGDYILTAVGMGQLDKLNARDSARAEEHLITELPGQRADRLGGLLL